MELEHLNEMGDLCRKFLIIELMCKHSNIIFCDEDNKIIDSIKHISLLVSSVREVLPGRDNFIPNTQNKFDPYNISENDFTENIYELKQSNELKIKENSDCNLFGQSYYAEITPVSPDNFYGRQALKETERGEIRTAIYDSIVYAVEHEMGKAEFRNIEAQVTKEDCNVAWDAVGYDYPQLFYYNSYEKRYQYEGIMSDGVIPEEDIDYVALGIEYHQVSDLEREKIEFEETSDYLIESAGITPGDSDYKKAKKLHNTLIGWVEYDHKTAEENSANSLSHTAYNAIVNHSAVCDGYARAYQYLLY